MSKRYPGGIIRATPVTPSGPYEDSTAPGIWTLDQAEDFIRQGIWPTAGNFSYDPYFEYVTMLLPGNGTNLAQNNTFLDSSTNNFTITRNGNTTQGTFSPYGSNWSNYLGTTSDRLTTSTSSSGFSFGTGDFTIEGWVNLNATSSCMIFQMSTASTGYNASTSNTVAAYIGAGGNAGKLEIYANGTGNVSTNAVVSSADIGKWNHLAIVRSSGTTRVYWNGTVVTGLSSISDSTNYTMTYCVIGTVYDNSYALQGYLSNFRAVKGTAVYTANFTPSTSPLTAITNTAFLIAQSNRFVDNSTNAIGLTVTGSPSVQRFSPFAPTAAYSAATIGGSGYFDGTGDYLNGPNTGQFAPTGDFTISMWFYPTSFAASYYVLAGSWVSSGASDEWLIQYDNTGAIRFLTTTDSTFSAAGVVKLNQWQFLTVSRSGSTVTGYINGTSFRSYTLTGTVGSATKTVYIGAQQGTTWPYVGWISDYRLVSGSAQSATPPTSPATAISGTNTLLSFTNGGIIDNAMMNDLETVGDAQISTAQSKFGGSSLYFDGTGDYLICASTPNMSFGSGDFTVEAWIYRSSTNSSQAIFQKGRVGDNNLEFAVYLSGASGGNVEVYYSTAGTSSTSVLTSVATVSLNTWTHIAVTRSGSTWRVFIGGTLDSSATASVTLYTGTGLVSVGANPAAATPYTGYIDDLRITKGYARYTANFTPSLYPFPTL